MKQDRNCGGVPMYNMGITGQFPVMPLMPIPNNIPYQNMNYQNTNYQNQDNDLLNRINNLEKRISTIEGIINSNNSYNTSNYQMM